MQKQNYQTTIFIIQHRLVLVLPLCWEIHYDAPGRVGQQIPLANGWHWLVCTSWLQWARERHRMMKVVKAEQDPVSECWWSGSNLFSLQVIMARVWPEMAPHTHITSPALSASHQIRIRGAWPESQSGGHRLLKSSHSSFSKTLFSVLFPPCHFKWMHKSR